MKRVSPFIGVLAIAWLLTSVATGQVSKQTLESISMPDTIDSPLGVLEFKDGAPSEATAQKLYDNLDFLHAQNVFLNTYQGASTVAMHEGFLKIGVEDNSVLIFPTLMDSKSLFLTANADTIYFISFVNLTKGPMVVEVPPDSLGAFDDMWFNWVIDAGTPGPDRGHGGKYLILPPEYDGPLPDAEFAIGRSKTTRVLYFGRAFMEMDDPAPVVKRVKETLKIYPYTPGGYGTSIATILEGQVKPGPSSTDPPPTKFINGSGKPFNTVPPRDHTFYELIDKLVQAEPAGCLDAELMGQIASIGIVKGQPFKPDARMKKILTDAAVVANAMAQTLNMNPRKSEGFAYYPNSAWFNWLFVGGYKFETPPPLVTKQGIKPFPPTGYRTLNSRTTMFIAYTGITPGMCMRLPGVGSQYLVATLDADKNYFDGSKTYKLTLPKDIPEANFWSVILYDNQTRSMLQTGQAHPKVGSQSYPRSAAKPNKDGSTTLYIAPKLPQGVPDGNWMQSVPGKGYFVCLRLYSPLEPFFEKTWRPSEIELVK